MDSNQTVNVSTGKRVIFDWSVDADNYSIVSKAMKKFSEGSQVELLCGKLSAEGLSENKLIKLIKYLKNDVAQGLNLSLNHLKNEGLIKVLPHLDRLSNLRCLDLSYNVFNLTLSNGDSLCKCFKEVFTSLRKLQDISLNYNRITGRMLDIISPLKTPVRLLKLDSCYLNAGDLSFLGNTMDISNLEVLDLSGNALSSYIQSLENLLLRSGNSLIKLTLAGTSLGDHEHSLTMLTRVAKGFKKLKFFSVQFNNFGREEQVPLVCAFASIKSMNEMKITEIRDEMGIDESDEAYNLALRIGGVPRDLSKYKDALDRAGCCDMFDLEIKDEEHGDLFVDPSDYGINYANL
ncbi:leucine-rich repeat-containing protein 14-like isoform X2 [Antedon mediterranea]|uniref:leucine-rich repeat-containing protein 14-like isoform X2 n=1 Tax=Antedon mediterranea TaxID=105859 RepID=UPI003AF737CA